MLSNLRKKLVEHEAHVLVHDCTAIGLELAPRMRVITLEEKRRLSVHQRFCEAVVERKLPNDDVGSLIHKRREEIDCVHRVPCAMPHLIERVVGGQRCAQQVWVLDAGLPNALARCDAATQANDVQATCVAYEASEDTKEQARHHDVCHHAARVGERVMITRSGSAAERHKTRMSAGQILKPRTAPTPTSPRASRDMFRE